MSSIWNCCLSCCKEKEGERDETSERTRLLCEPGAGSIQRVEEPAETGAVLSDEQAAKRRVFETGAADMIDVAAPYLVDAAECRERMVEYSRRLATVGSRGPRTSCLLADVPDPTGALCSDLVPPADALLIREAARTFHDSLRQVVVSYSQDVVVPFQIPWGAAQ